VPGERLDVRGAFGRDSETQRVLRLAGIIRVPTADAAIEDHRPLFGRPGGDGPERVTARRQRMSFDGDLFINGNGGNGVRAGVPEAAPVHDAVVAEERATARDGAVIGDRDVGRADALGDAAMLAARYLQEERDHYQDIFHSNPHVA